MQLNLSLSAKDLKEYVIKQLNHFFPDGKPISGGVDIDSAFNLTLERSQFCFEHINGYVNENSEVCFNHMHADQYATFLYFFANSLWTLSENRSVCDKLLQLNRTLHQLFLSYKCKMPDIFQLVHPIGSIIGNAVYDDYLVILQGVTVQTSDLFIPNKPAKLGKDVLLLKGASVIGNPKIGDRVVIGANVTLNNVDVPDDSIAYNDRISGELIIRKYDTSRYIQKCYRKRGAF